MMTDRALDAALASIARRLIPGGALVKHQRLRGGVSAIVFALDVAGPAGDVRQLVLRRQGDTSWKPAAKDAISSQYQILSSLHAAGLPVPEPLLLDASCELLPAPFFVMTRVDGDATIAPDQLESALRQMAQCLARIHHPDRLTLSLPALPRRDDPIQGALDHLPAGPQHAQIRHVLQGYVLGPREDSLLHGDYWPGNMLWSRGELVAVIDWEDAAIGAPASDLACARAELNALFGEAAAASFTTHYLEASGRDVGDLLLWDLFVGSAALATMHHWGLPPDVETTRRERTAAFVARAVRELTQ